MGCWAWKAATLLLGPLQLKSPTPTEGRQPAQNYTCQKSNGMQKMGARPGLPEGTPPDRNI